nr:DNA-3-methyladenine glycosylase isoform X2 [Ipomoea trifida]
MGSKAKRSSTFAAAGRQPVAGNTIASTAGDSLSSIDNDSMKCPSQPQEHYAAPANLERLLAANLKVLTENGISTVAVEAYRLDDSACHGRFGVTARTAPIVPNLTATQEQLLKEFFVTINPMSSGANSIGYLVLFVTASAFLLDLLCGSTEQLTLEI